MPTGAALDDLSDDADFLVLAANGLAGAGEYERAAALLRPNLEPDPSWLDGWVELARLPVFVASQDDVRLVASIPVTTPTERAKRAFAVATMLRSLGDYDREWEWIEAMNAALREERPFDPAIGERFVADVESHLDRDFFQHRRHLGSPSDRPIFVFGLPRSGTTLVEQILASHHGVRGGGEMDVALQAAVGVYRSGPRTGTYIPVLRSLDDEAWTGLIADLVDRYELAAGSASRVTDKMPSNDRHLGMLSIAFANATFVCVRRNPIDVCVSNYALYFGDRHSQADDLRALAHSWRTHQRLMRHWGTTLAVPIHVVEYERLVADPRRETERLLEACRLEWDPACLEFHTNPRSVATASQFQVRRPMYASSVGAWRRYRRHLGPLLDALREVGAPVDALIAEAPQARGRRQEI